MSGSVDYSVRRDERFRDLTVDKTLTAKSVVVESLSVKPADGSAAVPLVQKGVATLVGGAVTVTSATLKADSHVSVTLETAGGTLGTHYLVKIVDDTTFTIDAVDTAGAPVATDVSVVSWAVFY